jgi:hypothetical protein
MTNLAFGEERDVEFIVFAWTREDPKNQKVKYLFDTTGSGSRSRKLPHEEPSLKISRSKSLS